MQPCDPRVFYQVLGDLVRRKRKSLKLTQEKLAARRGISPASIANLETGRQQILIHQLFQLAKALDTPVEAFLSATADEANNLLAASGNANLALADLPLPKDLTPRQRSQISRLLTDTDVITSGG